MVLVPKLPVRVRPLAGESLRSLVRRQAAAMHYDSPRRILCVLGDHIFPPHLDQLGAGPALTALAALLALDDSALVPLTVHRFSATLILVDGGNSDRAATARAVARFFPSAHCRWCPICAQEPPVYERLLWTFRSLPVCTIHGCRLVEKCDGCGRRLLARALYVPRCRCGRSLGISRTVPVTANTLRTFRAVESWLLAAALPIPKMPAPATFWWLERLHSALHRTPPWLEHIQSQCGAPTKWFVDDCAWLGAAELFNDWPAAFREFLRVFNSVAKHTSSSTGVGRAFGLLLRDAQALERLGFPAPADALREYLLRDYTAGHITRKTTLFRESLAQRELARRPWITQTAAARIMGMRPGAVAPLVARGLLCGHVQPAGSRGRTVGLVSRASVNELRRQLATSLSVPAAARALGLDRHRVLDLIAVGVLARAVRTAAGWRLPEADVMLLVDLHQRLPVMEKPHSGWLSLREATRRFGRCGFTAARLIHLVQQGRLPARRQPRELLAGWQVSEAGLQQLLPKVLSDQEERTGYSLNRLRRQLISGRRFKEIVLRKWIRAGLLVATRRGRVWNVTPDEARRFQERYCLATEVCRRFGIHRTTLSRWERSGRLRAVYSRRTHAAAGESLYRCEDVDRVYELGRSGLGTESYDRQPARTYERRPGMPGRRSSFYLRVGDPPKLWVAQRGIFAAGCCDNNCVPNGQGICPK